MSNAESLVRIARYSGLIISSGARRAADCRGPSDVVNLAVLWDLAQDKGKHALTITPEQTIAHADRRKNAIKGTIKIIEMSEVSEKKENISNHATSPAKRQESAIKERPKKKKK